MSDWIFISMEYELKKNVKMFGIFVVVFADGKKVKRNFDSAIGKYCLLMNSWIHISDEFNFYCISYSSNVLSKYGAIEICRSFGCCCCDEQVILKIIQFGVREAEELKRDGILGSRIYNMNPKCLVICRAINHYRYSINWSN